MFDKFILSKIFFNKRLDQILTDLKISDSRNKAIGLIMSGNVFLDEKKIEKPGKILKKASILKIKRKKEWVSRGGIKLSDALLKFKIDPSGMRCLDIGCSTGGFTEVLLNKNAEHIYAVDVGYGQFDWKLRNSKKITLYERLNIRHINKTHISKSLNLVVCDVSFISIKKVFTNIKNFLNDKFIILSLIKPQFEADRKDIGKGGIVKNPDVHKFVCEDLKNWFSENFSNVDINIRESAIKGQKGNKEFFICVKN